MSISKKIVGKGISTLSIIVFLFIIKLWVTNDILLQRKEGFFIWGMSLIFGMVGFKIMKIYNDSKVFNKITIISIILSISLLILIGFIYLAVNSMT